MEDKSNMASQKNVEFPQNNLSERDMEKQDAPNGVKRSASELERNNMDGSYRKSHDEENEAGSTKRFRAWSDVPNSDNIGNSDSTKTGDVAGKPEVEKSVDAVSAAVNSIEANSTDTPMGTATEANGEDNLSDISDFSDIDDSSFTTGPMAWVRRQMNAGLNPRVVLRRLAVGGDISSIPADVDDISLWMLISSIIAEPPPRKRLPNFNTIEHVVSLLKSCNKIMVLTGAGVSVSCGIPDFRSRDGIYARLAVDYPDLPDPHAMFDIKYFRKNPHPFFKFAKEIYPGQFKPSLCHRFIRQIEQQQRLLRNYTQNIDTLEQVAGIERVVQCHGSFAKATCMACKAKVSAEEVREEIMNQVIPRCRVCGPDVPDAILKPDIVFFGESLPDEFHDQMDRDKDECDMLIVIGSSLKVRPVALIPNSLPAHVPQILINREPLKFLNFDVELLGDCDVIVDQLCRMLGSDWSTVCDNSSPFTQLRLEQVMPYDVVDKLFSALDPQSADQNLSAVSAESAAVIAGPAAVSGLPAAVGANSAADNVEPAAVRVEPAAVSAGPAAVLTASTTASSAASVELSAKSADSSSSNTHVSVSNPCVAANSESSKSDNLRTSSGPCEINDGLKPTESSSSGEGSKVVEGAAGCKEVGGGSSEGRGENDNVESGVVAKTSVATYLKDGTYLYLPARRYVFSGAELYQNYCGLYSGVDASSTSGDDDDDSDDSDDDDDDDDDEEYGEENINMEKSDELILEGKGMEDGKDKVNTKKSDAGESAKGSGLTAESTCQSSIDGQVKDTEGRGLVSCDQASIDNKQSADSNVQSVDVKMVDSDVSSCK